MTRKLSRLQSVLLGLVVLTGLALGTVALFAVGSRHWWGSDAVEVVVRFDDIDGVEVGTRVRIKGMDAGEVIERLTPGSGEEDIKLRLRLSGDFRHFVTSDAQVRITSEGLLSGRILHVEPGSGEVVADGETLVKQGVVSRKLNDVVAEADKVVQEFREGKGTAGKAVKDITETTVELKKALSHAQTTLVALQRGQGTLGKLMTDDTLHTELVYTLKDINSTLKDIRGGQGSIGMLVKNKSLHDETLKAVRQVHEMVASVKQNSDAVKSLPIVRGYVNDPHKELVRPGHVAHRKWFTEASLFEAGRAVLTESGKKKLDGIAPWINGHKEEDSEIVVAGFASASRDGAVARTITQKQAEAVLEYLRSEHRVHRMGFWWWSNRRTKAVGCGNAPPAMPERARLPDSRIEIVVFVPGA